MSKDNGMNAVDDESLVDLIIGSIQARPEWFIINKQNKETLELDVFDAKTGVRFWISRYCSSISVNKIECAKLYSCVSELMESRIEADREETITRLTRIYKDD